jgi:hypothetical protein
MTHLPSAKLSLMTNKTVSGIDSWMKVRIFEVNPLILYQNYNEITFFNLKPLLAQKVFAYSLDV